MDLLSIRSSVEEMKFTLSEADDFSIRETFD